MRRLVRPVAFAAIVSAVALGAAHAGTASGDPGSQKQQVDARLQALRAKLSDSKRHEGVLTGEVTAVMSQVRDLASQVDAEQSRLVQVEATLTQERNRLAALGAQVRDQSQQLAVLRSEYGVAVHKLERRVREIYVSDTPGPIAFVLGVSSFADVIDNIDLLTRIGRQDKGILDGVVGARDRMAELRRQTAAARAQQAATTLRVAQSVASQQAIRDSLVARRDALARTQALKSAALGSIRAQQDMLVRETDVLASESAALARTIAAAQAAQAAQGQGVQPQALPSASPPPPAGSGQLGWPVNGTLTSGFGSRGGGVHEGLDIAAPAGTPVVAAAAGTVIQAGWSGGYGNLVVIDHGNGLATAYAHNSSIAVSPGQAVAAGQVIAAVGSTGNSSGPHVHFEVRVNGVAVNPLGYL